MSLILNVTTLGYVVCLHYQSDELAYRAVRRRETELVRQLTPKFDEIWRDMRIDPKAKPTNPTTIADLLMPLSYLMEEVGNAGAGTPENAFDKTNGPTKLLQ